MSADHITSHLLAGADLRRATATQCTAAITLAAQKITESLRAGGKLLLCGNGGSAADCQHLAAEFTSRLTAGFVRPALAALALTTDTSFLTGFVNDFKFEDVFARQVQALGKRGDVLLGISTSGASPNVLRAFEAAHALGVATVALTGGAGPLRELAQVCVSVPSTATAHIQELHISIGHIICHIVERGVHPPNP
jgi:D-sedoheptulose 7-phosphate isomerase